MLVRFNTTAMPKNSLAPVEDSLAKSTGTSVVENYSNLGMEGLILVKTSGTSVTDAVQTYESSPYVLYAEPDYILSIPNNETESKSILSGSIQNSIPNDPLFGNLWGMHNTGQEGGTAGTDIDAPEAWDIFTGSSDVIIAVVDTGVYYNHSDLASNMWVNTADPIDGIDNDGNGYIDDYRGWDFYNNDNDPMDDNSHGTHCSGTIAGVGNNNIGVTGVNWNAKIMPLKFLGASGSGSTSDAISAILYANKMGAKVISNSWGGGSYTQALKDAIDASPAVVVCAAGNDYGNDNDVNPYYPSSYNSTNLIAVASIDRYDNISSFSNYGLISVDLGAPGSVIQSTTLNNTYGNKSGTSMATPHASGIAGLVFGYYPNITSEGVITRIMNSTDPVPDLLNKTVTGGRVNAYKAIKPVIIPPVANFSANTTSGTIPLLVQFTDLSTGNPTSWNWTFGDGSISLEQNPAYEYSTAGVYSVNLTSTNAAGSSTKIAMDYINATNPVTPPVATFTVNTTSGTIPLTIHFIDLSTNSPISWEWYFGDDGNSTLQNPVYTYSVAGSYTVNLTASNSAGSDTKVAYNYINATNPINPPVANFTANTTSGVIPLTVQFTDLSTNYPTSWLWSFGDGGNSTVQHPVYTYSAAGIYTVNLTSRNTAGSGTKAALNYINTTNPTVFYYIIATAGTGGAIAPNGTVPVKKGGNQAFTISPDVNYNVSDVTIDGKSTGAVKSYTFTNVSDNHQIEAYFRPILSNYTINASADPYTIIYPHGEKKYDGGDNQTFMTQAKPGSDLLNVTVDDYLNPPTESWTFTNITADHNISTSGRFTPGQIHVFFSTNQTHGKAPLEVKFIDLSIGDPLSFYWQFGDGYISTEQDPVHIYQTPGVYTVTLRATNNKSGGIGVLNNGIIITE